MRIRSKAFHRQNRHHSTFTPRCCKHHRRIIPRDLLGKPKRYKDGSIVSIALPRGKMYPYSSVRQDARSYRKAVRGSTEAALAWLTLHGEQAVERFRVQRRS